MRLECFTATWWSYATYAAVMGVAFVLGLPLLVFVTLFRHRHTLYGDKSGPTRARYGFLYVVPGGWLVLGSCCCLSPSMGEMMRCATPGALLADLGVHQARLL